MRPKLTHCAGYKVLRHVEVIRERLLPYVETYSVDPERRGLAMSSPTGS